MQPSQMSPAALFTLLLLQLLLSSQPSSSSSIQSADGSDSSVDELIPTLTIRAVLDGISSRRFTCRQLIAREIYRVEQLNTDIRAIISLRKEAAIREASALDSLSAAARGSLHCVPVVVKDNIDVAGVATTNGNPAFSKMVPASDSLVVAKLKQAGGIIIGKSNMAEMSDSGTTSESQLGGICSNPWKQDRSCLGSSGGSAAAVAAGFAVIGVGTDTEGSVIGPCVAAGLVCIRPSNLAAYASTGVYPAFSRQDEVGLMARSSQDFITAFDAVYGTNFTTTLNSSSSSSSSHLSNSTRIRFLQNFLENWSLPGLDFRPEPQIVSSLLTASMRLQQLGAQVENYSLPLAELGGLLGQVIAATGSKPVCSRSCMVQDLNRYFVLYNSTGPYRSAADLQAAATSQLPVTYQQKLNATLQQNASDICNESSNTSCLNYVRARATILNLMEMLIGNATAMAMPFTAKLPQLKTEKPGLADELSPALNPYTGWPSITIPVGFASNKLPIVMVMVAREGQEETLLRIAHSYNQRFGDRSKTPDLEIKAAVVGQAAAAAVVAAAAAVAVAVATSFVQ